MTTDKHNISRRQTLVGIGLAGATAIVPVAGATIAKAAQGNRSAFDTAVARLRVADAELQQIDAVLTSAHDAAEAACPRMDEFFKRYGLGAGTRPRRKRSKYPSMPTASLTTSRLIAPAAMRHSASTISWKSASTQ